jgi:tRNA (guanine6-N2)-methyltransferase
LTVDLLVRTVRGLEWVAAEEIAAMVPAQRLTLAHREVRFHLTAPDPGLLRLSTVDDVFVHVGTVHDVGRRRDTLPALARQVAALDFCTGLAAVEAVRKLPSRPWFDVVASVDGGRRFNRYDVEDIVGGALAPVLGGRYAARNHGDPVRPPVTLTVRLLLHGPEATVALRLGSHPLHRRDWKRHTAAGTLHPPVAAALARLAGPAMGETVADPFCGDGTIAIELALAHPDTTVLASDIDLARLRNASANAVRARVDVDLLVADAGRLPWRERSVDAMVANPPWNVVVDAAGSLSSSLTPFWRCSAGLLSPRGRSAVIANSGAAKHVWPDGFEQLLSQQVRLAGRVSTIELYGAPGSTATLPPRLAEWRRRALQAGIITISGF